jgi:hypothetical protein
VIRHNHISPHQPGLRLQPRIDQMLVNNGVIDNLLSVLRADG